MSFQVSIEQFEGPLDLMLHLIKKNELDLLNLDMNILTNQYFHYITTLQHKNVEIASEFLSELASLLEYKSKQLLPKEKVEITEEFEEDERDKLVARLLEYQNYKEASEKLSQNYEERQLLLSKALSEETQHWISESSEMISGSPYDLMKAMQKVLRRQALLTHSTGILEMKEVSLEQRSRVIYHYIHSRSDKFTFEELCSDCTSVQMVVVSFLVLLDLIKNQEVYVEIENDTIVIMRKNYGQ